MGLINYEGAAYADFYLNDEGYDTLQMINLSDPFNTDKLFQQTIIDNVSMNMDSTVSATPKDDNDKKFVNIYCNITFRLDIDFDFKLPNLLGNPGVNLNLFNKSNQISIEIAKLNNTLIKVLKRMDCCDVDLVYNVYLIPLFRFMADHPDTCGCGDNPKMDPDKDCKFGGDENFMTILLKIAKIITEVYTAIHPIFCLIQPIPGNPWMPISVDWLKPIRSYLEKFEKTMDGIMGGKYLDPFINGIRNLRRKIENCTQYQPSKIFKYGELTSTETLLKQENIEIQTYSKNKELTEEFLAKITAIANDSSKSEYEKKIEIQKAQMDYNKKLVNSDTSNFKYDGEGKLIGWNTTSQIVTYNKEVSEKLAIFQKKNGMDGICRCLRDALSPKWNFFTLPKIPSFKLRFHDPDLLDSKFNSLTEIKNEQAYDIKYKDLFTDAEFKSKISDNIAPETLRDLEIVFARENLQSSVFMKKFWEYMKKTTGNQHLRDHYKITDGAYYDLMNYIDPEVKDYNEVFRVSVDDIKLADDSYFHRYFLNNSMLEEILNNNWDRNISSYMPDADNDLKVKVELSNIEEAQENNKKIIEFIQSLEKTEADLLSKAEELLRKEKNIYDEFKDNIQKELIDTHANIAYELKSLDDLEKTTSDQTLKDSIEYDRFILNTISNLLNDLSDEVLVNYNKYTFYNDMLDSDFDKKIIDLIMKFEILIKLSSTNYGLISNHIQYIKEDYLEYIKSRKKLLGNVVTEVLKNKIDETIENLDNFINKTISPLITNLKLDVEMNPISNTTFTEVNNHILFQTWLDQYSNDPQVIIPTYIRDILNNTYYTFFNDNIKYTDKYSITPTSDSFFRKEVNIFCNLDISIESFSEDTDIYLRVDNISDEITPIINSIKNTLTDLKTSFESQTGESVINYTFNAAKCELVKKKLFDVLENNYYFEFHLAYLPDFKCDCSNIICQIVQMVLTYIMAWIKEIIQKLFLFILDYLIPDYIKNLIRLILYKLKCFLEIYYMTDNLKSIEDVYKAFIESLKNRIALYPYINCNKDMFEEPDNCPDPNDPNCQDTCPDPNNPVCNPTGGGGNNENGKYLQYLNIDFFNIATGSVEVVLTSSNKNNVCIKVNKMSSSTLTSLILCTKDESIVKDILHDSNLIYTHIGDYTYISNIDWDYFKTIPEQGLKVIGVSNDPGASNPTISATANISVNGAFSLNNADFILMDNITQDKNQILYENRDYLKIEYLIPEDAFFINIKLYAIVNNTRKYIFINDPFINNLDTYKYDIISITELYETSKDNTIYGELNYSLSDIKYTLKKSINTLAYKDTPDNLNIFDNDKGLIPSDLVVSQETYNNPDTINNVISELNDNNTYEDYDPLNDLTKGNNLLNFPCSTPNGYIEILHTSYQELWDNL